MIKNIDGKRNVNIIRSREECFVYAQGNGIYVEISGGKKMIVRDFSQEDVERISEWRKVLWFGKLWIEDQRNNSLEQEE